MGERLARIVIFGGILLFGLRGLMTEFSPAMVAAICLAISATGEYFYTSCFLRKECLIGEMARQQGWLTDEHIERVLSVQKDQGGMFGEIALKESYLSMSQVEMLLVTQENNP